MNEESFIRCTRACTNHAAIEIVMPSGSILKWWVMRREAYRAFVKRLSMELKLAIVDEYRERDKRHQKDRVIL